MILQVVVEFVLAAQIILREDIVMSVLHITILSYISQLTHQIIANVSICSFTVVKPLMLILR